MADIDDVVVVVVYRRYIAQWGSVASGSQPIAKIEEKNSKSGLASHFFCNVFLQDRVPTMIRPIWYILFIFVFKLFKYGNFSTDVAVSLDAQVYSYVVCSMYLGF